MRKRISSRVASTIAITALMVTACAKPEEHVLPTDPSKWDEDKELTEALKKLSTEQKELLTAYMVRNTLQRAGEGGPAIPLGTTVGQAIDDQKKWLEEKKKRDEQERIEREKREAEAKALSEKVRAEREAAIKRMNEALTVAVVEMKFLRRDFNAGRYDDRIGLTVAFENRTDKKLVGAKGTVVFRDMFGDPIKRVGLAYDEEVKPKATASWRGYLDFNQFKSEDNKLATTPLEKLKIEWVPSTYIYEGGEKLELPPEVE